MVQTLEKDRKERIKEMNDKLEKEAEQQKLSEMKQRFCFRCKQVFSENSNSPTSCTVHEGKLKGMSKTYACCGKKKGSAGCKVMGQHISNH